MLTQESSVYSSFAACPPMAGFFHGENMPGKNTSMTLNGKEYPHRANLTIASLLAELPGGSSAVVVEVNGDIIPKDAFAQTTLHDGDKVEVIHFVSGG